MTRNKWILAMCLMPLQPVCAGAWMQPSGSGQSITGISYTKARHNFGSHSGVLFEKFYMQSYTEQALSSGVSLVASPEYTVARYQYASGQRYGRDYAVMSGLRIGRNLGGGALSLQLSYKYGQTFSMTVSDNVRATQEAEIRPQYGSDFYIFGQPCFLDMEGIWRWDAPPRPNEAGFDLTLGTQLWSSAQLMAQNFSIFSAGYGAKSYVKYHLQKFSLSFVQRIRNGWRIQLGGIYAYSGQNVVAERGLVLSVWTNF